MPPPRCPPAVARFVASDGQPWRIYHVDRRIRPDLFACDLYGNAQAVGITHFGGRHKGKIFIDARCPARLKFDVTVHEISHVIVRHLGLNKVIEEAFVDEFATRMAEILEQL